MARFLPLGLCSLLSQISLVAAMAAINNMIRYYGALDPVFGQAQYAQIPMAVVGIVMKFFQIVISIAVGLAAGCISSYKVKKHLKSKNIYVSKTADSALLESSQRLGWDQNAPGAL